MDLFGDAVLFLKEVWWLDGSFARHHVQDINFGPTFVCNKYIFWILRKSVIISAVHLYIEDKEVVELKRIENNVLLHSCENLVAKQRRLSFLGLLSQTIFLTSITDGT